jgi:ribonuclease BN (tRNA processing enzyme)
MSGLRLLTLGIGDAFSARYYSSCFLVEAQGKWLLIDCPHPVRKMLREASRQAGLDLDVADLSAVALTHLHADHSSGLEGLAFYSRFVLRKAMPLLTHPEVAAELWPRRLAGGMEWSLQEVGQPPLQRKFEEFFELVPLSETAPCMIGPFIITCRETVHTIPTFALRIEAGGRTVGYSADTAFDPTLLEWLASADLIVHEASGGFMHTSYDALATLPEALRRKMRLIHCPDDFDPATANIECLREGQLEVI